MRYDIIETGSKGNAVIFNGVVLVDCGVGFSKLIPYYHNLQVVCLTHIHLDHFNKSTIKRLALERPTLRFVTPTWLVEPLTACGVHKRNIDVLIPGTKLFYQDYIIKCFDLEHDVPNCGYKIWTGGETIIYATDTVSLPDLPNCDYYFVEANYKNLDELAERVRVKRENGEFVYEDRVAEKHMSREYALNWLVQNSKPDSRYVFLHEHVERS